MPLGPHFMYECKQLTPLVCEYPLPIAQRAARGGKKHTQNEHKKSKKMVKNVLKKGTPKSDYFVVFWGLGPRRSRVVPKNLRSTLQGQILSKFVHQMVRGIIFL